MWASINVPLQENNKPGSPAVLRGVCSIICVNPFGIIWVSFIDGFAGISTVFPLFPLEKSIQKQEVLH